MNTPLRIAVGVSTLGGVGGGAFLLHQQLSTENVRKKLEANKYTILKDDSSEWGAILSSYKATTDNNLKFDGFTGELGSEATLKQKCKEALNSPSSENNSYAKAKQWCTTPRKLTDVLKEEGYRALSTKTEDDNNESEKGEWNKKLDEYAKENPETSGKKFTDSNIVPSGQAKKDKANRNAIRAKCKELEDKKHYEKDFKDNLEKAKLWCAVEIKQKAN